MKKKHGLVFKMDGNVWLGEYINEGGIEDASPISDEEGVYKDFTDYDVSLVEIEFDGETVNLTDLQKFTIAGCTVKVLLEIGDGPKLAKDLYKQIPQA